MLLQAMLSVAAWADLEMQKILGLLPVGDLNAGNVLGLQNSIAISPQYCCLVKLHMCLFFSPEQLQALHCKDGITHATRLDENAKFGQKCLHRNPYKILNAGA